MKQIRNAGKTDQKNRSRQKFMNLGKSISKRAGKILLFLLLLFVMTACAAGNNENPAIPQDDQQEPKETEGDQEMSSLILEINGQKIAVEWQDNQSVEALKDLVKETPLTISMSIYGGFEQVGSIGKSLPRNDVRITTDPGDIVLYSGNQIVVFYGSNTWSYTKLGRIENISQQQLQQLLGAGDVSLKLYME